MSAPSEPLVLVALASMAQAVERTRMAEAVADLSIGRVLSEFAGIARGQVGAARQALIDEVREWHARYGLGACEPSRLPWEPFGAFAMERDETCWTQWLATLWTRERGEYVARTSWKAFCLAVAEAASAPLAPGTRARPGIAGAAEWLEAADRLPEHVRAEEGFPGGRFDLVTRERSLLCVIENKIDAGWHDGAIPQDEKYAARAEQVRLEYGARGTGLVLLASRADADSRGWVHVTYARYCRHLREQVRCRALEARTPEETFALTPLLFTIAAIERHLLGVASLTEPPPDATFSTLRAVQEMLARLREDDPT